MSLREEMWKYEQITGESAEHVPIIKLGAFLDGYEMGLNALEPTRWIPVSSGKLPDEQTHVIVTIGNERFTSVQLCLYTSTSIFWKEYVKAWMPLPEPYKAESDEEGSDTE